MSYSTKLNPKILFRGKLILGSLLALTTLLIIAAIHQGIQTGEFDKVFVKPFKEFGAAFDQTMNATPSSQASLEVVLPSPSLIPTEAPVKAYVAPAQPVQQAQPTPTTKTYDQIKAEQDAWWANAQKQNEELSKQSQQNLESFRQQSRENLKQFEQEGQAGFEEFAQKYGIK